MVCSESGKFSKLAYMQVVLSHTRQGSMLSHVPCSPMMPPNSQRSARQVRFIEQYSQKAGAGGKLGGGGTGNKLHVVRVDGAGVPLELQASG